ncbi:TetR/AcrR family transcriptional regulator [Aeromicrobium massiliense]|uniref:TetR/AcrR family transcriptional regulator n=1 Tax=Aeromicrobium massiliense TaxID=1464554 RepID=UPI00030E1147|nr:TetR/AcrR family transcriptional regulator [Aeromicrobium massiliense]
MTAAPRAVSRRERNKQEKLDRITAAARELFAERGVDDVTTQQIAERADIGAGTLFLYARTKGELLLLVQNAAYEDALARGVQAADGVPDVVDAVMAVVRPVVECNRTHVDNGRTYLREMVFGDPTETHHAEALAIVGRTEAALADVLRREVRPEQDAVALAHVVSAVMFLAMAAPRDAAATVDDVVEEVRRQVAVVLRNGTPAQ